MLFACAERPAPCPAIQTDLNDQLSQSKRSCDRSGEAKPHHKHPRGTSAAKNSNQDAVLREQSYFGDNVIEPATSTVRWLKSFNRVATGSLVILLSGCTAIKAPKTLFITFGASKESFESDTKQVRLFLNTYTEAFQRSNPDTRIVFISYPHRHFFEQIEKDSKLNLGPDLILIDNNYAGALLARNLTTTLPKQQYFDSIYSSRIQAIAKTNSGYTFAPWLIDVQIACFDKTKIEVPPTTIQELEALSARGKKIGLASHTPDLGWTAGTQGAISEFSSLGSMTTAKKKYPAIKKWLQWLQRAAFYQNISFHKDSKELALKLKRNELDWITCWGGQLKDLETTMGHSLGIAALPNGATSKAYPGFVSYGFALGKNSSPKQRAMAMKFIQTDVNKVAQRKLQLDNVGFLAANKNVSVPPESSRTLAALNTSFNDQRQSYRKDQDGLKLYAQKFPQLNRTLEDLINGYLDVNEAVKLITTPQTK